MLPCFYHLFMWPLVYFLPPFCGASIKYRLFTVDKYSATGTDPQAPLEILLKLEVTSWKVWWALVVELLGKGWKVLPYWSCVIVCVALRFKPMLFSASSENHWYWIIFSLDVLNLSVPFSSACGLHSFPNMSKDFWIRTLCSSHPRAFSLHILNGTNALPLTHLWASTLR